MANLKALILPSAGVAKKQADTDTLVVGAGIVSGSGQGLTLTADTGNISLGTNLDGGDTYKITSLAAASGAGDALSYGQSSASLAGLTLTSDLAMGANNITTSGTVDGKDVSSLIAAISEASDTAISGAASGHVLIWDGTDSWDNKAVSGDITLASDGTAAIASGVIVNDDVSASAEIAVSKLAEGTENDVLTSGASAPAWSSSLTLGGTLGVTGQTTLAATAINGSVSGTSLITDTGLSGAANTNLASALAIKTYADNKLTGLEWKNSVDCLGLVGNANCATINGLSPTAGDAYVVTDANTITLGSISTAIGDLVEFDGSVWVRLAQGSGGFVPDGIRAVLSTTVALISPYTDATDDGKIAEFDGTSLTGTLTSDTAANSAVLVQDSASVSYYDNLGFVFEGSVPTGSWVQFTGAGQIVAGAGLTKSGNTINAGAGNGIAVNADDIEVTGGTAGGSVVACTVTASGVGVDADSLDGTGLEVDGSTLRIAAAAAGNGLTGGGGSALSVDSDTETGGNIQGVNVTANGAGVDINAIAGTGLEADGSANLRLATQGNGIAGGNGSTLSVNPDSTTGGNTVAVSVGANGVGLDVSGIAGTGLEADGSGNLRIAAAAAGDGLTGGAGSALAVNISGDFGLEIDTDVVKVDLAANGGLTFSTGLSIDLDGSTLSLGASGISVAGVPSSFTVNGVATNGTKVTAANLDDLCDGSNADSLHTHAAAAATEITIDGTADAATAAGQAVAFDNGSNGTVVLADANGSGEVVNAAGFANAAQATPGGAIEVQVNGEITVADAYWTGGAPAAADIGKIVWLSETAGSVTMTAPTTSGSTVLRMGYITFADASADTTRVGVFVGTPMLA